MKIDLNSVISKGKTLAIAVSGGSDSMALLHYTFLNAKKFEINVIALNVEHGIRGESSISDTAFVKDYCSKNDIPLLTYSVDSVNNAKQNKLSLEQSARILRYNCFFDAIACKKCDAVATAHHQSDNLESVLFNLFRGTSLKGVSGITQDYDGKIVRPLLNVSKAEIDEYVKTNDIPFVTDESNFDDDFTRNHLRLNVIPKIKEVFPEVEKSVSRFSSIAKIEDEYLDQVAHSILSIEQSVCKIRLGNHKAISSRAVIIALKELGLEKDWEKVHVDGVLDLEQSQNGSVIHLPKGIVAVREYDDIVIFKKDDFFLSSIPFSIGEHKFGKTKISITPLLRSGIDLKNGFYADLKKIPKTAIIRTKLDGDVFTKFGGGTKKLCDYLTDKKIPLRLRDTLPVLADGNTILLIFGLAVSNLIKVDESTENIVKFTCEEYK